MTNEQIVLDMFRAVEERDLERLAEIYAPDVEFVWPPTLPGYGGRWRGAEEVRAMTLAYAAAWAPLQATPELRRLDPEVVATGDTVVVRYHQRGERPDGAVCDAEVVGLYRIEDGRAARLEMLDRDPDATRRFLAGS